MAFVIIIRYILIVVADIGYFVYAILTPWRYSVVFWSRWQTITAFHAIVYPCLLQCGRCWIWVERPHTRHNRPTICSRTNDSNWIKKYYPNCASHSPFFSPLMMPMLLSIDASWELFELHSLLDGGRPTLPRSATPSGSLKPDVRRVPIDICCKPLRFSLNGPDPYLDNWPLCKLVDCCIRSLRKISSSESELVYPSCGRLRAAKYCRTKQIIKIKIYQKLSCFPYGRWLVVVKVSTSYAAQHWSTNDRLLCIETHWLSEGTNNSSSPIQIPQGQTDSRLSLIARFV